MDVLDHTLIWERCRAHQVLLFGDNDSTPGPITLADDPTLACRARVMYAEGTHSGRELTVAAAAVRALGAWDACLAWVTEWSVCPSGEDWPQFYAWRGRHGERRSLEAAPGHQFGAGEARELETLLRLVLENGWDATVLPHSRVPRRIGAS